MAINPYVMQYAPYKVPAYMAYKSFYGSRPSASGARSFRTSSMAGTLMQKKKKRKQRGFSFKNAVYKVLPAKHYTLEDAFNTTHNTLFTCVPTQGITQGTGNTNREGDRVRLMALKFKLTSHSFTTAGAYTYRIIIGWSGEEFTTANIASKFVSGIGSTELFLPSTAGLSTTNGIINPKAFTMLYDRTYDINSQVTGSPDAVSLSDTVQLDSDFSYQASASVQGKTRNLCMIIVATVNNGVTGTTSTGDTAIAADLIFKD